MADAARLLSCCAEVCVCAVHVGTLTPTPYLSCMDTARAPLQSLVRISKALSQSHTHSRTRYLARRCTPALQSHSDAEHTLLDSRQQAPLPSLLLLFGANPQQSQHSHTHARPAPNTLPTFPAP